MSQVFGYMQKHGCIFNLSEKIESFSKTNAVSKKWIYLDSWINKGIQLHLIMTDIHPSNPIYLIIRETYGYMLILIESN